MILMSLTLGKIFKRGGKSVRYVYSGGKSKTKRLVTKVTSKKFMKKTAKTILIAGVWYVFENASRGTTARERRIGRNQR